MAESVDALVSGTSKRKFVQVRVLFWALKKSDCYAAGFFRAQGTFSTGAHPPVPLGLRPPTAMQPDFFVPRAPFLRGHSFGSAEIPDGVLSPGLCVAIKSLLAKLAHKRPSYCIDNQRWIS